MAEPIYGSETTSRELSEDEYQAIHGIRETRVPYQARRDTSLPIAAVAEQASKQSPLFSEVRAATQFKARESVAAVIDDVLSLPYLDGRLRSKGGAKLIERLAQIALEDGHHDRDAVKAAELLAAYRWGRPTQTVVTVDVTPEWIKEQASARGLSDRATARLLAHLQAQRILPDPTDPSA